MLVPIKLVYPSRASEFTPGFSGVRITWSLVLCVCFVDRCLSFSPFSFGHCVFCSSIYGFRLPLWYLQTLLNLSTFYWSPCTKRRVSGHVQLTLVISNSMGPWKKFESTVVRLKRSYEDTGSVLCLTTKRRQLERNFEELKPASHVPILGTILNIFNVFVAVFFSPLNSLNLVKRLITSRYLFLCEWILWNDL